MKKALLMVIAAVTALGMTASSAYACKPIPPKDIEGHIEFVPPGGRSVAITYFQENGCDWGGREDLNGRDGVVLDVDGLGGTKGNLLGRVGLGLFIVGLKGEFLDASCEVIPGDEVYQSTDDNAYSLKIPQGATWFAITPVTQWVSSDVFVEFHSDGKVCKKKKKKKKGKGR